MGWKGQSWRGSFSGRHQDRLGKDSEADERVRTHTPGSILTMVKGMEIAGLHPAPALLFPAHHTYVEEVYGGQ